MASNSASKVRVEGIQTTAKVLLIGDSGVGKSSLMQRFVDLPFDAELSATIGIDFKTKTVRVPIETVRGEEPEQHDLTIQLWDTAGQERFRTLQGSYYRGAHCVVLVFSVVEPTSFQHVQSWLDEARKYLGHSDGNDSAVTMLLIGNKVDLLEDEALAAKAVTDEEAATFARENRMLYLRCSAKTRSGVDAAFEEAARRVAQRSFDTGGSAGTQSAKKGVDLTQQQAGGDSNGACC